MPASVVPIFIRRAHFLGNFNKYRLHKRYFTDNQFLKVTAFQFCSTHYYGFSCANFRFNALYYICVCTMRCAVISMRCRILLEANILHGSIFAPFSIINLRHRYECECDRRMQNANFQMGNIQHFCVGKVDGRQENATILCENLSSKMQWFIEENAHENTQIVTWFFLHSDI